MRYRNVVVMSRCDARSISDIRTNAPSVSKVNMDFRKPMVSAVWMDAWSFACACNSFLRVGGFVSSPLVSPLFLAHSLSYFSW